MASSSSGVHEIRSQLGYTTLHPDIESFKEQVKAFVDSFTTSKSKLRGKDLLKPNVPEQQDGMRQMVSEFLDKYGSRFWPSTKSFSKQSIHNPEDYKRIESLLTQLFWSTNKQRTRNKNYKLRKGRPTTSITAINRVTAMSAPGRDYASSPENTKSCIIVPSSSALSDSAPEARFPNLVVNASHPSSPALLTKGAMSVPDNDELFNMDLYVNDEPDDLEVVIEPPVQGPQAERLSEPNERDTEPPSRGESNRDCSTDSDNAGSDFDNLEMDRPLCQLRVYYKLIDDDQREWDWEPANDSTFRDLTLDNLVQQLSTGETHGGFLFTLTHEAFVTENERIYIGDHQRFETMKQRFNRKIQSTRERETRIGSLGLVTFDISIKPIWKKPWHGQECSGWGGHY